MKQNTRLKTQVAILVGSVILVFALGLYYFPKEYPELNFFGAFYFTLRLFILEHDLPTFPESLPLSFIHFFAPLIAFSAVWKAFAVIFDFSPKLRIKYLKDHVIICGVGRTGKVLASKLTEEGVTVIGIDLGPSELFEDWCASNKVTMIWGDFLSKAALKRAGANRARAVIFASGDDLLNIEGSIDAYGWIRKDTNRIKLLWTHISDERLADTARAALRTHGTIGIRIFDTYKIAAIKMVAMYFGREMRQGVKVIKILGFGKFGRDLFEVLARNLEPTYQYRIVDTRDRYQEVMDIANNLNISDRVSFEMSDINALSLKDGKDKAYFLCTDDDIGNLSVALRLSQNNNGTLIIVRMASWPLPAIESHLSSRRGLTFVNINNLVKDGLEDIPGIFKPAQLKDIKRAG